MTLAGMQPQTPAPSRCRIGPDHAVSPKERTMRVYVTGTTGLTGSAIVRRSYAAWKASMLSSSEREVRWAPPRPRAGGPAGLARPLPANATGMVCEVPTTTQPAMTPLNACEARCEALFASGLQPSDAPTPDMVAEAINCTLRRFGVRGCAGRMAQEFGDHPDAAATRMRWVRQLAGAAAQPPAGHGAEPPSRSPERGVAPA